MTDADLETWRHTALGILQHPTPPLSVAAGEFLAWYLLQACDEIARLRAEGMAPRGTIRI